MLTKKIVSLLNQNLDFHSYLLQIFVKGRNSWHQNSQKVLLCKHFGGHFPLDDNLMYEGPKDKFHSPPIKLLEFLLVLTFGHSVKPA